MLVERNWRIPDNEPVGSKVTQAHGSDSEGSMLIYGIESLDADEGEGGQASHAKIPFVINPTTGVVYLNESLKGKGGEDIHLYVTVSNGLAQAKTEVYVNILNSSNPFHSRPFNLDAVGNPTASHIPGIQKYPGHIKPQINNPPPSIANNPRPLPRRPHFQETKETENSGKTNGTQSNTKTYLRPVIRTISSSVNEEKGQVSTIQNTVDKSVFDDVQPTNQINRPSVDEQAVKTVTAQKIYIIPILSMFAIFMGLGATAFAFRRNFYLGKREKKEDMSKGSTNGSIVIPEDQDLAIQNWQRPMAPSNRYEAWNRDGNHGYGPVCEQSGILPLKLSDRWEFPRHRLKFFNILGEGAFGQVWRCEATELDEGEKVSIVAVKTLKENANDKERADLVSELKVMKTLEPHPNVVRLLGCCSEKEPIFLIMEYVSRGKLQSYLRNSRAERYYNNMHAQSKSLTSRDLTSFVHQVAKGMDYLSTNGIIHRDLAARNILITEDHVCKVADFGFARDVIASHVYERKSEGRLPIRWMAIESLYDNIFSVKSDVWSFGILMWEVVTLGSTPYPGMSAADVMKKVREGYRLDKPQHCRRELYNIMYYCWDKEAKQRPSFNELVQLLEKLLMTETDYIELERFPDHSYYNMGSLSGEKL